MDDRRLVRRIQRDPDASVGAGWPFDLPPVAQLLRDGLDLAPGVTFLAGENGSGKSTLVEALAAAYGLNAEGGSRGTRHSTRASESDLHRALQLVRGPRGRGWAYFLRAETMHGLYTYLEDNPSWHSEEPLFHELSHGESFLEVLSTRFDSAGFYLRDEPSRRCPSPRASPWSACSPTSPRAARRSSARRTRPCSPPCPARR